MRNSSAQAATVKASRQSTRFIAAISASGLALGAIIVATNPVFANETRSSDFQDFSKIDISESIDVHVVQSNNFAIETTARNKEILDSVVIEQSGDTLKIHRKEKSLLESLTSWMTGPSPKVTVSMPNLTAANVSAGADLTLNAFSLDNIEFRASSGADIDAYNLNALSVIANSSSGADIQLAGTCDEAEYTSSSGADINAGGFECKNVLVDASSGADATIYASQSLKADASSGSDIKVRGNPSKAQTNSSSGGEIEQN